MNIHVVIFTYRPQSDCIMSAHENMIGLRSRGHQVQFGTIGSALVHRSRNLALASVSEGHDAVIFLDDDMLLTSPDSLATLIDDLDEHPIVSGLCTTRGTPKDTNAIDLAVKQWNAAGRLWFTMEYLVPNKVVTPKKGEYFGVGAACLAVRRDAAIKLIERYLNADDWLADNRTMLDRLHVRNEYRIQEKERIAAARYSLYEESKHVRVFGFPILENEVELGEDVGFSMRCMQADIPIAIDTRITPGHVGDYPYGVWNYVPKLERMKAS